MLEIVEYPNLPFYHPDFFTATTLEWKMLLRPEKYKRIITNSLSFLVREKKVNVNAFVIMGNHIHLIWQILFGYRRDKIQQSFLKFTAQEIIRDLKRNHPLVLPMFRVDAADRVHQIWERNPLSIELYSEKVFHQKLDYIHLNPVKAGLCKFPEQYKYSSAKFYETGINDWDFLTHYDD